MNLIQQLTQYLKKSRKSGNNSNRKGQLSLEYLIILVSFFSVLFLFTPIIFKTYYNGTYSIKLRNAEETLNLIEGEINSLKEFEPNSRKKISLNNKEKIEISVKFNSIEIDVKSEELEEEKKITRKINYPLKEIQLILNTNSKITLIKEKKSISVTGS